MKKNIEVGKAYRTRGGGKARIYALDGEGDYPVHGALWIKSGWHLATWTRSGHYLGSYTSEEDVMGEWKDPHPLDRVKPGSPIWVRNSNDSTWLLDRFVRVDKDGSVIATAAADMDNNSFHLKWDQAVPYRAGEAPDESFYENKDSE